MNAVPVPNMPLGYNFMEAPWCDSHIYVSIPDQHGLSACGYGKLYELTLLAIGLRNNLQFNQQFAEVFGMPYRYIKTDKMDKKSQDNFEATLSLMGSLGYGIIGKDDELEFIDTAKGQGFKIYGDLEMRIEKKISKILLGHADGIDSTKGALGAQQGADGSPQAQALADIQASDGEFMMEQVNSKLFDFMRNNGINIPHNLHFEYINDTEDKEIQKWTNEQNISITAAIINLNNAGYPVMVDDVELKTGFKIDKSKLAELEIPREKAIKTDFPSKSQLNNLMNAGKKPAHISQEEWDAYKLDLDYKKQTKGFDGNKYGLTKEEYQEYAESIQEAIETDTPLPIEDGDCNVHINCRCVVENGVWVADPDCCDDCASLMEDYNTEPNAENKANIFNSHLKMKKNGLMSKG
jgi:hypothetical protein